MVDNSRMNPQGDNEIPRLRASDADRDNAASVISNAMAEGRLTAEEHSDRLDAIYAAKTQADLVPLLDDLPGKVPATAPATAPEAASGEVARIGRASRIVAIFGGASRKGSWHAERVTEILTVFGGADIDLREAVLPGREITIKATCVFGGVDIIVPPEMRVIDSGTAIFGGRDISGSSPESERPGAPVLYLTGSCVFGGIDVKRKQRKQGRGKGWQLRIERG
jgi:Domain of unknown function (DUF1707)/Cell wall-active antibiotics response 4TMS YvqF